MAICWKISDYGNVIFPSSAVASTEKVEAEFGVTRCHSKFSFAVYDKMIKYKQFLPLVSTDSNAM